MRLCIKCNNCGKEFYITKSRFEKNMTHCCCKQCSIDLKKSIAREKRKCLHCGKDFIALKRTEQKFCCVECHNIWQKGKNVGVNNPKFTSQEMQCDYCNKTIYVPPHRIKKGVSHFCSEECRKKWYSQIWSQSEDWKIKSKIRAVQIMKQNPVRNSTPQIFVNNILDDMGLKYENEYDCKYFSIDNYLMDSGLMIEIMGDYWHCNPNKFCQNEITKRMKIRISRDKAKHTYIKKYYGIEILYIWEQDCKNKEFITSLIEDYVLSNGELSDYNSFNYYYEDKKVQNKKDIIQPYFLL